MMPVCCRLWQPLMSALYFNLNAHLFAPVFTSWMGMGDKETFAMAILAHGLPVAVESQPPSAVGKIDKARKHQRRGLYGSNTMAQFYQRQIMFLHANFEKWTLAVNAEFENRVSYWDVVMPGKHSEADDFAQRMLRERRCAFMIHGTAGCVQFLCVSIMRSDCSVLCLADLHMPAQWHDTPCLARKQIVWHWHHELAQHHWTRIEGRSWCAVMTWSALYTTAWCRCVAIML